MLRIRLQRTGNRNNPSFRLVVADKRNAAKGKSNEILGHYLPTRDPAVFEANTERVQHWISMGAQPTDTVARLLAKAGMKDMEKYSERYTKKRKKNAPEEEEAPPPPPPAAEPETEAPAAEEAPAPSEEPKEDEKPAEEPKEEAPAAEPEVPAEEEGDKKEADA